MKSGKRILLIIFLVFLSFSFLKNIFDYRNKLSFFQSFQKEYTEEKKINSHLKTQILKNNDQENVERVIRNQLNLSKKGEIVVVIPDPTPHRAVPTPTAQPPYQSWWKTFFEN